MKIFERVLEYADLALRQKLANQIMEEGDPYHGGVRIPMEDIVEFHQGFPVITKGLELYMNPKSSFYKQEELLEKIDAAIAFAFRSLNANGTKHYIDCDFYTPAGSETQSLGETLLLMRDYGDEKLKERFFHRLTELLEWMAHGIMVTGFATPNHRWIFAGALAVVYHLTGKPEYLEVIGRYLGEGIDCNEDGDYAERSAGIYNRVTNRGLILIGTHLGKPEYYEYVRRNLLMMKAYLDPDGSVFTMNSTRQDYGKKVWAESYFGNYLLMGELLQNREFTHMALCLYAKGMHRGWQPEEELVTLCMMYPGLQELEEPQQSSYVPGDGASFFQSSGVVRVIKGDISLSLLRDSPTFFYGQFGSIECYMRIYAYFFKVRNVLFQKLEETKKGYRLSFHASGNFYLPFEEKQDTSDWWKMDHSKRKVKEAVQLDIWLDVNPGERGVDFLLHTDTCDRVPLRIELGMTPNHLLTGSGFRCRAQAGMSLMPTQGMLTAENTKDAILIGPVFGEHGKTEAREGALPQSSECMTLYFNPYCREKERYFSITKTK